MSTTVCESCGAANPADASFCQVCRAFIGWDRTAVLPQVGPPEKTVEESTETRVLPKIADGPTVGQPGAPRPRRCSRCG